MKKLFFLLPGILFFFACNRTHDTVVAEVYTTKLYQSEVQALMPDGLNREDSIQFSRKIVDDWVKKQVVIYHAEKELSVSEKNFKREIENFRRDLLINAYYRKLTSDTSLFQITSEELESFLGQYNLQSQTEREIIKLNYVKLSPSSSVLNPIRSILFDEERRTTGKAEIEKLCGDSLEYFIEDNTWLYLDNIQNEIPVELGGSGELTDKNRYIERRVGDNYYLVVLLDYKSEPAHSDTQEQTEAARAILQQQRRTLFITRKTEELYQKALRENKVIR